VRLRARDIEDGTKYTGPERIAMDFMALGGFTFEEAQAFVPNLNEGTWSMLVRNYVPKFRKSPDVVWAHIRDRLDLGSVTELANTSPTGSPPFSEPPTDPTPTRAT